MNHVETALCASLLRGITDEIKSTMSLHPSGEDTLTVIRRVQKVSHWAIGAMRSMLSSRYPQIGFADLENARKTATANAQQKLQWIYDPIDGAYHFAQELPLWSASLTLLEDGRPVASFVYDPSNHEMFSAAQGEGSFLNGKPLRPLVKTALADTVVGTALPLFRHSEKGVGTEALAAVGRVAEEVFVVRMMAAASLQLAYVAAGRLDAYWEAGDEIEDWIAGALLVEESGLTVTDFCGKPLGFDADGIIASSKSLSHALRSLVAVSKE